MRRSLRTPRSQIRAALRRLWLRSRERAAAVKREGNTCQECGRKGSAARGREVKIHVHHLVPPNWDRLIDKIMAELLCDPSTLEVLCVECHATEHEEKP